jgi:hypothetical protein
MISLEYLVIVEGSRRNIIKLNSNNKNSQEVIIVPPSKIIKTRFPHFSSIFPLSQIKKMSIFAVQEFLRP